MKKLVLCALALVALSFLYNDAQANFVMVNPHVSIGPNVVTATVVNPYRRAIICSGFTYGQAAYSGTVFNSYMNGIVIYPGGFYNLHVYNQWEPFGNGWANIQCRLYY